MIIHIGSINKTKIEAVTTILADYPDFQKTKTALKIKAFTVSSDVAEQPMTLEETIQGAINRAKNAFNQEQGCNYSIGIESGYYTTKLPELNDMYFNTTICAIYDGKEFYIGQTSSYQESTTIMEIIKAEQVDTSEAYKRAGLTTLQKIGNEHGSVSLLTNGRINRMQYTMEAIRMALIKIEKPELYQ